jgi:DNA polymerase III gamma/tau subunit
MRSKNIELSFSTFSFYFKAPYGILRLAFFVVTVLGIFNLHAQSLSAEALSFEQLIERYAINKVAAQKKAHTISFNPSDKTNSEVIFNFADNALKPIQYFRFGSRQEYFQIGNQKFEVKDHHDASRFEFFQIRFKGRNYICALGQIYGNGNSMGKLITYNLFDITNEKQIRRYRNYSFDGQIENICNIDNDTILDFIKIEKSYASASNAQLPENVRIRDWFKVETYNFLEKKLWHKYRDYIYACDSKDGKYWAVKAEGSAPPTNLPKGEVKKTSISPSSSNTTPAKEKEVDPPSAPAKTNTTAVSASSDNPPKSPTTAASPPRATANTPNQTKPAAASSKAGLVPKGGPKPQPSASMKQTNPAKAKSATPGKVSPKNVASGSATAPKATPPLPGNLKAQSAPAEATHKQKPNSASAEKKAPPLSTEMRRPKEKRFEPKIDTAGFFVP